MHDLPPVGQLMEWSQMHRVRGNGFDHHCLLLFLLDKNS